MAKKKFYTTKVESNEPDCEACGLSAVCKSPKLKFIGKGKKNVLIIGSQPTSREDLKGELGYGDEAVFLESALEEIGIDFYEDCFFTTTVACRPPRDRKPNATEYMACKPCLEKVIERLEPAGVILLGDVPYSSLIQPMIAKGRMNGISSIDLVGDSIPDQKLGYWVFPTYGIDYLMERKQWQDGKWSDPLYMRDVAIKRYFLNHLKNAFDVAATRPFPRYVTKVEKTTSIDQAIDWLYEAMDWKYLALDYETNSRKPHKEGKIWYASISNGVKTYAFPFFSDPTFVKTWTRLMSTDIGKIAHNDQFEYTWTKVRGGGCWIKNWIWDTMIGQHCRNNQKKTNLKYCVYTSFGIAGYDSEADGYIVPSGADSKKYGGYALNTIHEADPQMAMEYNGLDSLFTAWLYEEQKNALTEFQLEGMKLLLDASIVMAEVSEAGIPVDEARFDTVNKELNSALEEAYKEIMEMDDVKQWDGEEPINLGSPKQLSHLLFDILKIKPIGYTDKSRTTPSTDKESLIKMNRPFLKKLIEYREFSKMVTTYIDGWKKETVDGVVHSSFNFNTVDTFRSSSDGPNVQTAYKRDKKKKKIVRSLVKTLPGYCIAEYDYRSLEVIVNGCHSKDPSLKKYCTDPSTDMHRDGGMDIFEMTKEELLDEYRSNVKGLYIFSEFYGNWYGQVAKDLWDYIQETPALLAHMKSKGYRDYATFELHVKECEDLLWGTRFKKHSKWRKEQWAEYQVSGLLVSNTGFHLYGPMRKNNTFNCKVQGDGFHILCHTMINVHKKFKELGLKSHIVNEIHDSLVIMVWPPEEELVDYWVWYYGTVEVMEYWKWITIPLQMEKERSKIDGNWSEMEKCGFVNGGLCLPKDHT